MRPHKITLEAFGPFITRQSINFDNYSEFVLIAGQTGSGKTTIFDAIMFSLYGDLPGTRDTKSVVSSFSDGTVRPFVEMIFSLRGLMYKVIRVPSYLRPAKKGKEKMVEEPSTVVLYEKDGDEWIPFPGKLNETNLRIADLVHLNAEEFSKIVLLPQGEFQKFLVSETKEKRDLLAKIFPVSDHEAVSEYIREIRNEKRSEYDAKLNEQKNLRKLFDPESFEKEFELLKKEYGNTEKKYRKSRNEQEILTKEFVKAEELEKEFIELDDNEKDLKKMVSIEAEIRDGEKRLTLAEHAEKLLPFIKNFRQRDDERKEQEEKIRRIGSDLKDENENHARILKESGKRSEIEKSINDASEELASLRILLPKESELNSKKLAMEKLRTEMKDSERALSDRIKAHGKLEVRIEGLKASIREMEKEQENYQAVVDEIYSLSEMARNIKKVLELKEETDRKESDKTNIEKSLRDLEKTHLINLNDEMELKQSKESSQAANLASLLEPGLPCPVCGSTEHPEPADREVEPFTDGERLLAVSQNIINSGAEISKLKERISNNRETIKKIKNEILNIPEFGDRNLPDVMGRIDTLEKKKIEIENAARSIRRDRNELQSLEGDYKKSLEYMELQKKMVSDHELGLRTMENEIKSLSSELHGRKEVAREIERMEGDISGKRKRLQDITDALVNSEKRKEGLTRTLKDHEKSIAGMEKKLESAGEELAGKIKESGFSRIEEAEECISSREEKQALTERIKNYHDKRKEVQVLIDRIRSKIAGTERPDLKALRAKKESKNIECNDLEKSRSELDNRIRDLERISKQYSELENDLRVMNEEAAIYVELANDLNGRNSKMINFQNYILGAYLRKVTQYATERFNRMSEGRYSLIVNEEIVHGGRQTGLELDVYDSNTGQRRSVRSLSGGEKFLASISLSLGLADVIQSRAGDIELDAIFIDEGFGSLDDSALDRALSILDEIKGNRLVGIISHVTELKIRIPSQIQVLKGSNGSTIKQVY